MIEWNFNMDEAPKGQYREVPAKNGKVRKVYDAPRILAADRNSDIVTITYWLVDGERWNMFNKDNPPLAWAPWPKHPQLP